MSIVFIANKSAQNAILKKPTELFFGILKIYQTNLNCVCILKMFHYKKNYQNQTIWITLTHIGILFVCLNCISNVNSIQNEFISFELMRLMMRYFFHFHKLG